MGRSYHAGRRKGRANGSPLNRLRTNYGKSGGRQLRMQLALEHYRRCLVEEQPLKLSEVALNFNVDYCSFRRRAKGWIEDKAYCGRRSFVPENMEAEMIEVLIEMAQR